MSEAKRELGIIGLGRMGGGLALQARERGIGVVGYDPVGLRAELASAGVIAARTHEDFRAQLARPRAIFLYIPAGPVIDATIDALVPHLEAGDIIVDGGNSYWGDSRRRHARLAAQGIQLIDLGTSGGVEGARHGACFMAGGEREAVARIEPMLLDLAVAGGYVHAGGPGAGHFTKLVHNGIEFGMLQAIAEGMELLTRFDGNVDVAGTLSCWRNGSVIRSWLVDLMHQAYVSEGGLAKIPAFVEDTGEVNWLVADALRMEAPVPVIAQAVMQLFASRDGDKTWAKAIAMMRHGFGGHPYGASPPIVEERRTGQVGATWRPGVDGKAT